MTRGLSSRTKLIGSNIFALTLCFLLGAETASFAVDHPRETGQDILSESMNALLTGKEGGKALKQKQQALREALKTGEISKTELVAMLQKSILPILKQEKTSRYILKTLPEKFDEFLAPYMEWQEAEEIMWKACSSVIKEGQKFELKIGTLAPPGTPWLTIPETELIPKVEKLSNGKVIIKIYGGGVMGEDVDILRKMDIGQLEGCGCTALGILTACPEISALLLPGLFKNYDEVEYITEKFRKQINAYSEKRGYILAALIDTGFFNVYSKNKITCLDDLKKLRILTWIGPVETSLYKELGINATPVAVPEVVAALSTGLADTCLAPSAWMLGMQAYQYANYYIQQPFLYSPAAVIVSTNVADQFKKKFGLSEQLADNIVELLVFEVSNIEIKWREHIRAYDEKCLNAFRTRCGIKPVSLTQDDLLKFFQAAKNVQINLAGKAFPEDFMQEILQALEEYRIRD